MTATDAVGHAHEVWLAIARPIAAAILVGECAQTLYLAGDRDRALAYCRMALGHAGTATLAALDARDHDPVWAACAQFAHAYLADHIRILDEMLAEMTSGRALRTDPSRDQLRCLKRMLDTQTFAVAAARAVISGLGGNPDLAIPPGSIYLELKAQAAPPWPEIEN